MVAWQPRTSTLGGPSWLLGPSSSMTWMTDTPRLIGGRGSRPRRILVPWSPRLPALDHRPRDVRGCVVQARPSRVPRLAAGTSRSCCRALVACDARRSHVADGPPQGGRQGIERCNARMAAKATARRPRRCLGRRRCTWFRGRSARRGDPFRAAAWQGSARPPRRPQLGPRSRTRGRQRRGVSVMSSRRGLSASLDRSRSRPSASRTRADRDASAPK